MPILCALGGAQFENQGLTGKIQVLYYDILSPFWSIPCVSYRLIFYHSSDALKRHHYKTVCSSLMTVLWITMMIMMIQWLISFEFFLFDIPATCRTCIKACGCFKISPQILCSSSFPKAGTESPSLECRSHQRLAEVTVWDLSDLVKRTLQLPPCFLFWIIWKPDAMLLGHSSSLGKRFTW